MVYPQMYRVLPDGSIIFVGTFNVFFIVYFCLEQYLAFEALVLCNMGGGGGILCGYT